VPRACTVCMSPDRDAVDAAIVERVPFRTIAHRFAVTRDAAMRHRAHVSASLMAVQRRRDTRNGETLADRIESLYTRASAILDAAETEGRSTVALAAVRELRAIVELLGKLTGEIDDRPQMNVVNVLASPDWIAIRSTVLDALTPFPDARAAVAARLLGMETPS
jgi:hypothetical protein